MMFTKCGLMKSLKVKLIMSGYSVSGTVIAVQPKHNEHIERVYFDNVLTSSIDIRTIRCRGWGDAETNRDWIFKNIRTLRISVNFLVL